MRSNMNDYHSDLYALPNREMERLSFNSKHKVLPPLNSSINENTNKLATGQNPYMSDTFTSGKKTLENQERYYYKSTAAEIRESDEYINNIIQQRKHESKRKDNSFDELCATLVKQHELERVDRDYRIQSPIKQAPSSRQPRYDEDDEIFLNNSMSGKTFLESKTFDISTPRNRTKGEFQSKENNDTELTKQTTERPKSAKYGERRLSNRPRTGYGRRKQVNNV